MQLSYLDFELEIGIGQGRDLPVVARSPAGEARALLHFPFDELALESRLKDLQIALLRSGGNRRQALSSEQQAVRTFGQALFDALFNGEVRNRYDVSLQQARSQGKGLRIKLQVQSPAAAALPWEYLYDPRQSEYCVLSVETPLVRYLELPQPITPLTVTPPLRMLAMLASPTDLPALDFAQEKQRIEQSTQGLRTAGRLEIEWLAGQGWRDLQGALRRGPWHIFHFSGHGRYDALTDEGQLIFADDQGRAHVMPASDVGRLLANHRTLRLAWLNACEGARGGETDIFSSAASLLVRRGVPAVVAMQYEITDRAAIELARTFYEAVADGYPVDAALAEARVGVSLAVTNTVEWGTPALFMRAPDGVLFDMVSPAPVGQARVETETQVEVSAGPAPEPGQPLPEEAELFRAPAAPSPPTTVQKPRQHSLGRVLLSIAALAVAIGVIVLIVSKTGSPAAPAQPKEKTVMPGSSASTAPTGNLSEAPTQLPALPGNLMATDLGIMVTDPIQMELVRVPAGEFLMGGDGEASQHQVAVAEFYLGKYEVTNAQYAAFVEATGYDAPEDWESGNVAGDKQDYPVLGISWHDAMAFTEWLSKETGAGFRLPTEAEWEQACRGVEGFVYPWGDMFDATKTNTYESGIGTTTPVGTYSPEGDSPYGVADMAGNVLELTSSAFRDYPYDPTDGREDSSLSERRVLRGGSFNFNEYSVRCVFRSVLDPTDRDPYTGFRVALSTTGSATSTGSTSSATQTAITDNVTGTEQGATVTKPIRIELVRVPAGEYLMGSDPTEDRDADDDEKPQHPVSLAEYFIGKYEVTNEQYAVFVEATGHRAPDHWENGVIPTGREDHPVVYVSWDDAVAFAEWLSAESGAAFRLPSEAEWEKACRGSNELIYPWGDSAPNSGKLNYNYNVLDTTPVGSYSPDGDSPYGATDVAGNVREWVADEYDRGYYAASPIENPRGPEGGDDRVLRGGSFDDVSWNVRCAARLGNLPNFRDGNLGFRVVVASP